MSHTAVATAAAAFAAAVAPVAPSAAPSVASRFAAYRQRKRTGAATRVRRTQAQLQALESKPLEERTEQEKQAVRNHRKQRKRQAQATANAAAASTPATTAVAAAASATHALLSEVSPSQASGALSTPTAEARAFAPLLVDQRSCAAVPCTALAASGVDGDGRAAANSALNHASSPPMPLSCAVPTTHDASAAAAASPSPTIELLPSRTASTALLPPNALVACARRFAAAAARGCFGKPYKLHHDQQEALLRAVTLRVADDVRLGSSATTEPLSASRTASLPLSPSSAGVQKPTDAPYLAPSERTLVHSVLGSIVMWPSYFSQLYAMLPRPRARRGAAAAATAPPVNAVQQQLEVYEYIRDTGLQAHPRIGTDVADADDRGVVRASLQLGSDMEEAAFTTILRSLVQRCAGLPLVHVPPQLLSMWAMLADREGSDCADAAMRHWCEEHRDALLGATYVAFHWSQGHYCSLVLNMDTWRNGPPTGDTAATTSTEAASSPSPKKRARTARARAGSDAYSCAMTPVPFLHLDTLHAACHVLGGESEGSSTLSRICRVFNGLCATLWPADEPSCIHHVHLCGPPPQQDEWSCGFHLLRAWALMFQAGEPFTPLRLTEVCAAMAAVPIAQLVEETRALYVEEEQLAVLLEPVMHPSDASSNQLAARIANCTCQSSDPSL